jgi:hypothetical protein
MEESMALSEIELRVAALEAEMVRVKKRLEEGPVEPGDWLSEIYGAFANDSHFEEAMRLGRKYRESLRPKATVRAARKPPKAGRK